MDRPRLGRIFFFDNSVVGSGSESWAQLRGLADGGWIELWRASALGDDLARDSDMLRRSRLEEEAAYPEMLGVFVRGESRLNSAVLGSDEEARMFERLFAAVFPGTDRSSESRTTSSKRRDVMHLHTCKKYGSDGFITRDTPLLKKADVLRRDFDIEVFSPDSAIAFVNRLRARYDVRCRSAEDRGASGPPRDADLE